MSISNVNELERARKNWVRAESSADPESARRLWSHQSPASSTEVHWAFVRPRGSATSLGIVWEDTLDFDDERPIALAESDLLAWRQEDECDE